MLIGNMKTLKNIQYNFVGLNKTILLLFFYYFYLFLAVLGLRCCVQAFSSGSKRGLLFAVVCGLLIAVTSLVAEHKL